VRRGFRVRLYPDERQEAFLSRTLGCVRFVWNHVLAWRRDRWQIEGVSTSYNQSASHLTELKHDPEFGFLREVPAVPLQQALLRQQEAFSNYFAGRSRYPRFKNRGGRASMKFVGDSFSIRGGELRLAKVDRPVRWIWSFDLAPEALTVKSVTVVREPDGSWWASLCVELTADQEPVPLEPTGKAVGVDLGVCTFGVLSDGSDPLEAPDLERKEANRKRYQRRMARKQPGSKNRDKARRKAARAFRKERQAREDMLQQASTRLVREYDVICIEDLNVSGMVKNHRLARQISRMGWRRFRTLLEMKCARAGKRLAVVDRWNPTSKTCSIPNCGLVLDKLPLGVREWTCPGCGTRHDRDLNAAKNILAAGLAVLSERQVVVSAAPQPVADKACGADMRPGGQPPSRQSATKQEVALSDEASILP
jgi:putative transposase